MVIAYFDCYSGVAGDMVLGALIDAGLSLKHLNRQLKKLPVTGYKIEVKKEKRGISGTNVKVNIKKDHHHSSFLEIDRMIEKSSLPRAVISISRVIFEKLARAEAKVHGTNIDHVHFHEVGATDSIIDIVGSAIGLDHFGFDAIYSSPLPVSRGKIKCAHGVTPSPAPATLEILKGIPLEPSHIKGETVTPTGAAILGAVVESFGECPLQKVERVGYGFGDRIIPNSSNALRIMIGEGFPVVIVEADIDDMNPQIFEYVIEKLFGAGAVDVNLTALQMKKSRPATRLAAVVPWNKKDVVMNIILKETTTFGVRYYPVERKVLVRKLVEKKIKGEKVRFKVGYNEEGRAIKAVAEYEDIKKFAKAKKMSISEAYRLANFPSPLEDCVVTIF